MSAPRADEEESPSHELFMDAEDEIEDDDDFEPGDEDEEDDDLDDDGVMEELFAHADELEDDDEFHDAEQGDVQFVVEVENGAGGAGDGNNAADDITQRVVRLIGNPRIALTQRQLLAMLRGSNLGHYLFDEDDDDEANPWGRRRRQQHSRDPNRFPAVPSEKGRELMNSGTFGATEQQTSLAARKRIARRILDREMGTGTPALRRASQGLMAQSMLPTSDAEMIINYEDPVYSGQFSDDGNFFYSCVKDFRVRMYDTSNPYNWRHYKTVAFPGGSWTLTDASLSPDNKWLAYTSIESRVCLAPTDPNDTGDPYMLNLAGERGFRGPQIGWRGGFGIWSIRFSGDGKELVAGTNSNSIVVYDIESRQVLHSIEGHEDHVNAVCFADKSSPHILYSGSDDATIKVWDRRSMGDGREAGAFVGHIEGLTYIDSKGDGRYILSNGKDQSMKMWDLKMMYTTAQFREKNPTRHTGYSNFDYRWEPYSDNDWFPHPDDNSVVTFRGGHKVLRTLIRCHFSPPGSTDSRYVYTGSHDGKVWIYNMDATVAGTIDVRAASMNPNALPGRWRQHHATRGFRGWSTCVRDASWHPNAPFIAASSLNGWDHNIGTVTVHSFNENTVDEGEPRMGAGYNDKLRPVGSETVYGSSNPWEDEEEEDESEEDDEDE
ncbi:WD40-repeat-containing domain protein [Pestalotiopsis sp. NC0098]|nr:WD40-repeat-containing domain protein [Pestalotiopsis sp. NC0098]